MRINLIINNAEKERLLKMHANVIKEQHDNKKIYFNHKRKNLFEQGQTKQQPTAETIARDIFFATNRFGTNVENLLKAVESIGNKDMFDKVNEILKKNKNGKDFLQILNDEICEEADDEDLRQKIIAHLKDKYPIRQINSEGKYKKTNVKLVPDSAPSTTASNTNNPNARQNSINAAYCNVTNNITNVPNPNGGKFTWDQYINTIWKPGGKITAQELQKAYYNAVKNCPEKELTKAKYGATKLQYKKCNGPNFNYLCINNKIAEIQNILGVKPAKGYYGPKTLKTLINKGYVTNNNKILTPEIIDKITKDFYTDGPVSSTDSEVTSDRTKGNREVALEPTGRRINTQLNVPIIAQNNRTAPSKIEIKPNISGEQLFNRYKSANNFNGDLGDERIAYRGPDLGVENRNKLIKYLQGEGYRYKKMKDKRKGGEVDVWVKNKGTNR